MEDIKRSAPTTTNVINNVPVSTSDVQIDPSRTLWFRLFTPSINPNKPLPLIVYIHGEDNKAYDDLCTNLAAKAPAVIASINFRLTPNHKYPTQYDDGYDALKFFDAAVLPANTDLNHCFILGDSAGANIVHHVTIRAVKNADHFDKIRIAGIISLQPFFRSRHPFFNLDDSDRLWRENDPAAPLVFPPTLGIMGENDLLLDWQKKYFECLKNCGTEVELTVFPNTNHGFYLYPEFPKSFQFDLLFQTVTSFIRTHLSDSNCSWL